jgi:hypothetical protein
MRNHRKERFLESQIISSIISEISFDSESWRLWEPKSKGLIFHKSVLSSTLHLAFWWTQLVMWRRYSCWFHTIHTYTHTHVHTHARKLMCTCTPHMHTHVHIHTYSCAHTHTQKPLISAFGVAEKSLNYDKSLLHPSKLNLEVLPYLFHSTLLSKIHLLSQ